MIKLEVYIVWKITEKQIKREKKEFAFIMIYDQSN